MKYMTEKEKMLAGEIYSAVDIQLLDELAAAREMIHDYNLLRPSENGKKLELLKGLLGYIADDAIIINQPFYCDYGKHICVGKRFFANFNFTVLDEARVAMTVLSALMSASIRPVIAPTLWNAILAVSGLNLYASAIMFGLVEASPSCQESPLVTT